MRRVSDGLFKFHLQLNLIKNEKWEKAKQKEENINKISTPNTNYTIKIEARWDDSSCCCSSSYQVVCFLNVQDEFKAAGVTCVSWYGEERVAVRGVGRPSFCILHPNQCNFIMNQLYVVWLSCRRWRQTVCAIYIVNRHAIYNENRHCNAVRQCWAGSVVKEKLG